jgi:hypothetical protein
MQPSSLCVQWHKIRSIWLMNEESIGKCLVLDMCLVMDDSTLVLFRWKSIRKPMSRLPKWLRASPQHSGIYAFMLSSGSRIVITILLLSGIEWLKFQGPWNTSESKFLIYIWFLSCRGGCCISVFFWGRGTPGHEPEGVPEPQKNTRVWKPPLM